ncbi:VCBS repeat-containing protein, partial [bacterium]|nr:VCBS repeat-containing protein [bacterium]
IMALPSPKASAGVHFTNSGADIPLYVVNVGNHSAPSFVDIDGDGDYDAFIGEQGGTIKFYENTGTAASPAFTENTGTANPFGGVDFGFYSAPTFVDIDGDGDYDAFIGEENGTIKYYQNTGTAGSPEFTPITGTANPFDTVDIGSYSKPAFVDIDADGDYDAFIGENNGTVKYYKNTGTAGSPAFTEITDTDNPFNGADAGDHSIPSFADIDGDGDYDAFIGEYDGIINYYKNTGTAVSPAFTEITDTNNPFNGLDAGYNSAPAFVDIDGDGDYDAFIGEYDGIINYYKNTGTAGSPAFTEITDTNNPFNSVDVGDQSAPAFLDIDNDGDYDAFIGEYDGIINYYKNTGTAGSPAFTEITGTENPFNGVDAGDQSAPAFVDIDNDEDYDAFIGVYDGMIKYYENTGTAVSPSFIEKTDTDNPLNGVGVGYYLVKPSFVDIDNDGDYDVFIGELYGTIKYYQNTGSAGSPDFTEKTGTSNPFNGVDVGSYSSPSFVDIDGDGDYDAFIGEDNGTIKYYKNTGTAGIPAFTENTGTDNPFDRVDLGSCSTPAFVDIDNDKKMDAFIGELYGVVNYYINDGDVLLAQLAGFSATPSGNVMLITWQTLSEMDSAGFRILRAEDPSGPFTLITKTPIPAQGNAAQGAVYTFEDTNIEPGKTYYYRLEEIDSAGNIKTLYTPVQAKENTDAAQAAEVNHQEGVEGEKEDKSGGCFIKILGR